MLSRSFCPSSAATLVVLIACTQIAETILINKKKSAMDKEDIAVLSDQFVIEGHLGEGTYGVVYRAKSKETGALYAIKQLRLDGLSEGVPATAVREITLLQDLSPHPNIVRLLDVICRRHRLFLVFELMTEDLRKFIARTMAVQPRPTAGSPYSAMPLSLVKRLALQMLNALWYCHQSRVVHRDLKPGNILIDDATERGGSAPAAGTFHHITCKLADFGLARTFELPLVTYTNEVVTLWYRAPEILLGETRYTPAVDLWSVGCIVGEMLLGRPLFRGENQIDQLQKIFNVTGTPNEESWNGVSALCGYSTATQSLPKFKPRNVAQLFDFCGDPDAGHFVADLLTPNPKLRPTTADALAHRWLASGCTK